MTSSSEGSLQPVEVVQDAKTSDSGIIVFPPLGNAMQVGVWDTTGLRRILGEYLEGICNRWRTTHSSTKVAPPPCVS